LTRESYDKRVSASRMTFIVLATVAPVANLVMITIEAANTKDTFEIAQPIALSFLVQASSQAVCFLVVGSFLVRKLFVYFKRNYDC